MDKISRFFQKIASFCAYQERCLSEVKEKLYEWEAESEEIEAIIEKLIDEKYIDEERFAKLYVGSKFRTKKWGKVKIKYMLKQKKIPVALISKGLQEINPDAYYETLKELALQKKEAMKNNFDKAKLYNHLISKGYENDLVREAINEC
ncbi:MAG: RecX family transcriptional regulator [Cytophagales bacterium]|nr:MAG: RecX family transcriptional regulator [Cytophagales bacterium]